MEGYSYVKKFIDRGVKQLDKPLKLTKEIENLIIEANEKGENANKKHVQQAINKTNVLVKRHNRNMFRAQIVNQIIEQIMKSEKNKLLLVNESILRMQLILQPIVVPSASSLSFDSLVHLGNALDELPSSKYLFINNNAFDLDVEESDDSDHGESRLIIDDHERIENEINDKDYETSLKDKIRNVSEGVNKETLLKSYDQLVQKLKNLLSQLKYKHAKLMYLEELRTKLIFMFTAHDIDESSEENCSEPFDSDDDERRIQKVQDMPLDKARFGQELQKFKTHLERLLEQDK